jgi:F-type H+-transporting ATPase subunit delta
MSDHATPETVHEATGVRARIARVYAEALVGAAGKDQMESVGDELDAVAAGVFTGHPRVSDFLADRTVARASLTPMLRAAFDATTSPTFRKFLGVLNENGRLDLLPAVAAEFRRLRDAAAGRTRVRVTAAVPLDAGQIDTLKATLAKKLHAQPVLDLRTDPDILGGLVVQVGDKVYDSSVRTRLDNLRNHLTASASHG